MFARNEANYDRIIRVILAIALFAGAALTFNNSVVLAVILGVLGLVMLVTGTIGWCPIYAATGLRTLRENITGN